MFILSSRALVAQLPNNHNILPAHDQLQDSTQLLLQGIYLLKTTWPEIWFGIFGSIDIYDQVPQLHRTHDI
jgi:hypothetical protein